MSWEIKEARSSESLMEKNIREMLERVGWAALEPGTDLEATATFKKAHKHS